MPYTKIYKTKGEAAAVAKNIREYGFGFGSKLKGKFNAKVVKKAAGYSVHYTKRTAKKAKSLFSW